MGKAQATQPSGRMSNASTSTRSVRAVTVLTRPVHAAAASRAKFQEIDVSVRFAAWIPVWPEC